MSLRPIVFAVIWKAQALWRRYTWRFSKDLERPMRSCHGLIHVGANIGQERDHYEKWGLDVVWVEPIPETYAALVHNIRNHPRQKALNALVTDIDGSERVFHISNNEGLSSSIFDLKLHKELWPTVGYARSITLETVTLPTLLRESGIDARRFDCLVLDTQGSELLVLRGAGPLLQNFRYIKTEVADFEAYEGCCLLVDLDAFLRENGFVEFDRVVKSRLDSGGTYYDIVYRRTAGSRRLATPR
jgi:FkbM family methyltransferase